jgi:CheY-like chemotaxis protein
MGPTLSRLEAIRLIDIAPPDAVVLDLGPHVDGYAVRQELAAHAHTRSIPAIVVTARPGDHPQLGVACVLTKPVLPDRLVNVVRDCLVTG